MWHSKINESSLPYYLSTAGSRIVEFIHFSKVLALSEMQSRSSFEIGQLSSLFTTITVTPVSSSNMLESLYLILLEYIWSKEINLCRFSINNKIRLLHLLLLIFKTITVKKTEEYKVGIYQNLIAFIGQIRSLVRISIEHYKFIKNFTAFDTCQSASLPVIIIIIISCWQHGYPWPSLATPPYRSSP